MQIHSVQISYFIFKVHFNITLPSTNSTCNWCFSSGFSIKILYTFFSSLICVPYVCHISRQFDHLKYIWRRIQIRNLVTGRRTTTTKLQRCIFESCWLQKWQMWITSVTEYVRVELKRNNISVQMSSPIPLGLYRLWSSQAPQYNTGTVFSDISQSFLTIPTTNFLLPTQHNATHFHKIVK